MKGKIRFSLLFTASMSASLPLLAATPCPADMVTFLESKHETKLVKRQTTQACSAKRYPLSGEILDIDGKDEAYTMHLSTGSKDVPFSGEIYEVALAQQHGCGNLAALKKGAPISMQVRFDKFGGYSNR